VDGSSYNRLMRASLDLKTLATRESEQVEWKENVADIDDVVATICAFANDLSNLGGGYVVCGAREDKDEFGFPQLVKTGLSASRLREVEGTVLTRCREQVTPPIVPLVDELPADAEDRRLLVFTVAATKDAHAFRRQGLGAHYVRIGRSTRQARNGVLLQLLATKGVVPPWDERPAPEATDADLDLLAIRNTLNSMGLAEPARHVETYLSATEVLSPFIPSLCVREAISGILRPRNFALALFGRMPQRFIRGAISYVSIYPGLDRSEPAAIRHELAGTLLEQIQAARQVLDSQALTVFDKESPERANIELYPKRALLEALVNAFAHRDYTSPEPTRVTIFLDRIEYSSPGGLPPGVSLASLRRGGRVGPKWRNRGLAWFFQKLELAQAEGQGIATIRSALKAAGCPPPRFEASEVEVRCILRPNPRGLELARQVQATLKTT
jgi:ATP-dependent DNA helicase RecG